MSKRKDDCPINIEKVRAADCLRQTMRPELADTMFFHYGLGLSKERSRGLARDLEKAKHK